MSTENMTNSIVENIDYKELKRLHELYNNKKRSVLSRQIGKDETKHIWFKLTDDIKGFLLELLKDKNVTGLKVYLCTYDDEVPHGSPYKPEFAKQITVGMVATHNENGNEQCDYVESENKMKLFVPPPQNHGQLCPPNCG